MSDAKPGQEPTMEEILASIRQIISDDPGTARKTTAAAADDGEILELTQMMNDDGTVTPLAAAAPREAPAAAPKVRPPALADVPTRPTVEGAPSVGEAGTHKRMPATAEGRGMLSEVAAGDVAATLGGLADAVGGSRQVQIGGGGKTLETLVKELLRPMLKDWLNENLPPLVERLVEREIHRISGRDEDA